MLSRSVRSSKLRCTRRRFSTITLRPLPQAPGIVSGLRSGNVSQQSMSSLELCSTNSCEYFLPRRCFKSRFAYPEGMKEYNDDWVDEPDYPPIDPEIHTWNERRRERLQKVKDWHTKIKNASCPEAKNLEWNMQRKYGWKTLQVSEDGFDYNSLKAYKFATRTHVASNTSLPSQYLSQELNEKVEYFKNKLKEPLLDVLNFELDLRRSYENDFNQNPVDIDYERSKTIIPQLNRVILSVLGQEIDCLRECQVDTNPNVQAYWQLGGQEPLPARREKIERLMKLEGRRKARYVKPNDPVQENIHYLGKTLLQVRCMDPPENFVDPADPLCKRSMEEFPDRFPHFLRSYGFKHPPDTFRFAAFSPGHWSGDVRRCNLVAFHPRHHLLRSARTTNEYWSSKEETEEALLSQGMLVSFGRLMSQALYHGFDQFTDLNYPFSTQTVITNGLEWSFFAYQLNTIQLDSLSIAKNQKQNVIWGTQTKSIFDAEKEGELNDEVVSNLLRFYLNPPTPIQAENPTPYLGRRIQDWEDDHERTLIFHNFRDMVIQKAYVHDSLIQCRPPEIYEYEWVYKIKFNTRPMDKRLKFFEFPAGFPGSEPLKEPYYLIDPTLISKGVRWLIKETEEKKEKAAEDAKKAAAKAAKFGDSSAKRNKRTT